MTANPARAVTVCIDEIDDHFEGPNPGSSRYLSGIEELYRAVKAQTGAFKCPV